MNKKKSFELLSNRIAGKSLKKSHNWVTFFSSSAHPSCYICAVACPCTAGCYRVCPNASFGLNQAEKPNIVPEGFSILRSATAFTSRMTRFCT